jgi:hypothetical protein
VSEAGERYARQILLPEIGANGQELLSSARFVLPEGTDPRVADVARTYLSRAGLTEDTDGTPVQIPLDAAGDFVAEPHARAFLLGALAAVEHVKTTLSLGAPMKPSSGKLS